MNKLIIGIDCDGVLRDFDAQIRHLAAKEGVTDIDFSEWNYLQNTKVGGIPMNQKIWKTLEWARPLFTGAPVIDGALEAYRKFCEDERFLVNIVTSQTPSTAEFTHEWLSSNKFVIHNETIVTSDKHESGVHLLIDDRPKHIEDHVENDLLAVLISRTYNVSYDYQPRTSNLLEAYKWITNNIKTIESHFSKKQSQLAMPKVKITG